MRRVVVNTAMGDISDVVLEDHDLAATVVAWLQVLPDAGIYIDGHLVTAEMRQAMQRILAADARAATATPVEPAAIKEYGDTLQQCFGDLRQGYVQLVRDMQDSTQRTTQLLLEHQRQFAEEVARQRQLTCKSLADVDLLGRSVKAAELSDAFAMAGSRNTAARLRREQPTFMDVIGGIMRALAGMQ
jgi:hypothetical protein